MPDQSSPTPTEEDLAADRAILSLLLDPGAERPWLDSELVRETGTRIATMDGIARLHSVGLVHRCGKFVFASRAALRADQLGIGNA
jgi:hypothetical protein